MVRVRKEHVLGEEWERQLPWKRARGLSARRWFAKERESAHMCTLSGMLCANPLLTLDIIAFSSSLGPKDRLLSGQEIT